MRPLFYLTNQDAFYFALIGIAFIGFIYLIFQAVKKQSVKAKQQKVLYDAALKGNDKAAALAAGRKYYSALRGGRLTVYDEQALTNDLNAMG